MVWLCWRILLNCLHGTIWFELSLDLYNSVVCVPLCTVFHMLYTLVVLQFSGDKCLIWVWAMQSRVNTNSFFIFLYQSCYSSMVDLMLHILLSIPMPKILNLYCIITVHSKIELSLKFQVYRFNGSLGFQMLNWYFTFVSLTWYT